MPAENSFDLKGKVAIVIGGAGLLGREFTAALAGAGARVVLADRAESQGRLWAKRIAGRLRTKILFLPVEITDPDSTAEMAAAVYRRFGRIDILVNAVMAIPENFYASVEDYSWEDWNRVMSVNVGGVFLACRDVARWMKKKKSGSIINMGSIYGVVAADQRIYGRSGINSPAAYAASKAAVIHLTHYLAAYWGGWGIRVNAISPGGIANQQPSEFVRRYSLKSPQQRMVNKKELCGALLYLASGASSSVTGHNLLVDGGWTLW